MRNRAMSVKQFEELQRLKSYWVYATNRVRLAESFKETCDKYISTSDSNHCVYFDQIPEEVLEKWSDIYLKYAREKCREAEDEFGEALNHFVEVD